ncbi:helix-turn-helix domain-containing protein [Helcococcus kunzii]
MTKSSKTLFIHKNTLQYKLNKLEKLTGYNPRTLDDFVVLKLAFLLG